MSIIIRLQNLPWAANSVDIRRYFEGLSIPEGGVHIVGGEKGDAFIAFSTDEDARQAMERDGGKIKETRVKLLLSSRTEMHRVIEQVRNQNLALQSSASTAVSTVSSQKEKEPERRQKSRSRSPDRRRDRSPRDRDRARRSRRDRSRSRSPRRRSRDRVRDRERDRDRDRERDRDRDRPKRDERRSPDDPRHSKDPDKRGNADSDNLRRSGMLSNGEVDSRGSSMASNQNQLGSFRLPPTTDIQRGDLRSAPASEGRPASESPSVTMTVNGPTAFTTTPSSFYGGTPQPFMSLDIARTFPSTTTASMGRPHISGGNQGLQQSESRFGSPMDQQNTSLLKSQNIPGLDSFQASVPSDVRRGITERLTQMGDMPSSDPSHRAMGMDPHRTSVRDIPVPDNMRSMPTGDQGIPPSIDPLRGPSGMAMHRDLLPSDMHHGGVGVPLEGFRGPQSADIQQGLSSANQPRAPSNFDKSHGTYGQADANMGRLPVEGHPGHLGGSFPLDNRPRGMNTPDQRQGPFPMGGPQREMFPGPMGRGAPGPFMDNQMQMNNQRGMAPDSRFDSGSDSRHNQMPFNSREFDNRRGPLQTGMPQRDPSLLNDTMRDNFRERGLLGNENQRFGPNKMDEPERFSSGPGFRDEQPRPFGDGKGGNPESWGQRRNPERKSRWEEERPPLLNPPQGKQSHDRFEEGDRFGERGRFPDMRGPPGPGPLNRPMGDRRFGDQRVGPGLLHPPKPDDYSPDFPPGGPLRGDQMRGPPHPDDRGRMPGMGNRPPLLDNRERRPLLDSGRDMPPRGPPSTCLEFRHLPYNVTIREIKEFLHGIYLARDAIKLVYKNDGSPAGVALIRFGNERDVEEAMNRRGQFIRNRRIDILPCPEAVYASVPPSFRHSVSQRGDMSSRGLKPREEDLCLMMKGLPFECKEEDVIKFFDGLQVLDICIDYDPCGKAVGTGFVEFCTPEDFQEALTLSGKMIGHRFIFISVASKEMMNNAKQSNQQPLTDVDMLPTPDDVEIPPPGPIITSGAPPLCASLHGFSPSVKDKDIADMFEEGGVIPRAIHILLGPGGKPCGEAFVEFNNQEDFSKALNRNSIKFRGSTIIIKPVAYVEMQAALGPARKRPEPLLDKPDIIVKRPDSRDEPVRGSHRQSSSSKSSDDSRGKSKEVKARTSKTTSSDDPAISSAKESLKSSEKANKIDKGKITSQDDESSGKLALLNSPPQGQNLEGPPLQDSGRSPTSDPFSVPGCVVGLSNVPYRSGVDDILQFFRGYKLTKDLVIRRYNERGLPTGDAKIAFSSPQDAQRAVRELNMKPMQGRPVYVFML